MKLPQPPHEASWRLRSGPVALCLALSLVLASRPAAPAQAQSERGLVTAAQIEATAALARTHVRAFLQLRLAANQLQRQYAADAEAHDDVVQAFFAARERMLRAEGWTPGGFEALEARVMNAQNAIDMLAERDAETGPPPDSLLGELDPMFREMLQEVENTPNLPAAQREQLRQQILAQQKQLRARPAAAESLAQAQAASHARAEQALINATRPDWPAVRPYLSALDHLTRYIAGDRPDPPDLTRLEGRSP